jgi:hypothetical protein
VQLHDAGWEVEEVLRVADHDLETDRTGQPGGPTSYDV